MSLARFKFMATSDITWHRKHTLNIFKNSSHKSSCKYHYTFYGKMPSTCVVMVTGKWKARDNKDLTTKARSWKGYVRGKREKYENVQERVRTPINLWLKTLAKRVLQVFFDLILYIMPTFVIAVFKMLISDVIQFVCLLFS